MATTSFDKNFIVIDEKSIDKLKRSMTSPRKVTIEQRDYELGKETITLHHKSLGQEVTHVLELSDYNSMMQGYINFLRGIGVTVPEEEDRV